MKKILPFLIVIGMAIAFLYACGQTGDTVAYDSDLVTITPTYPNNDGGSTSTTTDPGTGIDNISDPDVLLNLTGNKSCTFLALGDGWSCALKSSAVGAADTKTYCWGRNYFGTITPQFAKSDIRYGNASSFGTPQDIGTVDFGSGVPVQISGNQMHVAVNLDNGLMSAFGSDATINDEAGGQAGFLGDRNTTIRRTTGYDTRKVSAGYRHTMVLLKDGRLTGFGGGTLGQLGVESRFRTINKEILYAPNGDNATAWRDVFDVAAGSYSTYIIRGNPDNGGDVYAVGKNGTGNLGYLDNLNASADWHEVGISDAVAVAGGSNGACALRKSGKVVCWGKRGNGIIGDGSSDGNAPPTEVPGIIAKNIFMGNAVVYAIRHNGELWSWGSNGKGQLAVGSTENNIFKPTYTGLDNVTDVDAYGTHVCAKTGTGLESKYYCAGEGIHGRLGIGASTSNYNTFQEVTLP